MAKSRQKAQQKVVIQVQGARVNKPQRKKPVPKMRRVARQPVPKSLQHTPADHFALSQVSPFAPEARGARQLTQFPLAVTTAALQTSFSLTSSAGGVMAFMITGNPLYALTQGGYGLISGGVLNNGTNMPVNVYAINDPTVFSNNYARYRVVSVGIRFRPTTSFTTTSGHGYVAATPSEEYYPAYCAAGTTASQFWAALDVPQDGTGISSAIQSYPKKREFTFAEILAEGGADINMPISSPRHEDWLETATTSITEGLAAPGANVTTFANTITPSRVQTAGWSTILVQMSGLPASTVIGQLQLIYHIEALPQLGSGGGAFVPTGSMPAASTSPEEKHGVLQAVAQLPLIRTVAEAAKHEASLVAGGVRSMMLKGVEAAKSKMANKVLGLFAGLSL